MSDIHHFEALNYALRKSKDGIIVSFVVHPNDVSAELTALPIGARLKIAWTLADDEKPKVQADISASVSEPLPSKDRRKFHDLPLSQQCAMRCTEERFLKFLGDGYETSEDAVGALKKWLGVESRS